MPMPSTHRLSVNLTAEEHREITALAEASRVSRAWIGRQALIEFLERYREPGLQLPLDLRRTSRRSNQP
ncbi:MAG: CopG family transcriptional regulator [Gemmatimonadetes bacterium]|nr:CopG family transcriptional regulator [Gemmatimonadota bacterium]MYG36132.1 CopG family transcriptional regulator [Gemmatimonadota bacterium]